MAKVGQLLKHKDADSKELAHVGYRMFLPCFILLATMSQTPADATLTDLGDGYIRVKTSSYSIEVPKGWKVTQETPWGQRKAGPEEGEGELGVMTAPPSKQSWDQLYQTSLYFILREEKGKPTPYEVVKSKSGYEAASFSVLDEAGFAKRQYVLLRHPDKGLLALSVSIPDPKSMKTWSKHFKRLVETAKFTE